MRTTSRHGTWRPPSDRPPAFIDCYDASRCAADPITLEEARIRGESITAEVLLVAGGDDKVWDSLPSAQRIVTVREQAGLATTLVSDPMAGHPIALPGEVVTSTTRTYQVGGDGNAPERLGRLAWPHIARVLGIGSKYEI